jgi:hypothetical protein
MLTPTVVGAATLIRNGGGAHRKADDGEYNRPNGSKKMATLSACARKVRCVFNCRSAA